jgi:phosphomannomutase
MPPIPVEELLRQAAAGLEAYARDSIARSALAPATAGAARDRALAALRQWLGAPLLDAVAPGTREGIADAIRAARWADLLNAFQRDARFGTAGIRALAVFDKPSLFRLRDEGLHAPILKGPNTFNNVVLLRAASGIARYGLARGLPARIVIGHDTRVRGADFARETAGLFLAYGYTVFLFDGPSPYPETGFAVTRPGIGADFGLYISSSHNDYRYNGFKLVGCGGAQVDADTRNALYNGYIAPATFDDIRRLSLEEAPPGRLIRLGEEDGPGRLALHPAYRRHLLGFLSTDLATGNAKAEPLASGNAKLVARAVPRPGNCPATGQPASCNAAPLASGNAKPVARAVPRPGNCPTTGQPASCNAAPLAAATCAYHGSGRGIMPRLLESAGFETVRVVTGRRLDEPDGLFPAFGSEPGREQQPDPGDDRAAAIVMETCRADFPDAADRLDLLVGTDPDADRCGVITRVPRDQQALYGGPFALMMANELWTLLLWFRLHRAAEAGRLDAARQFITLSHVTQESLVRVAQSFGLGAVKTWVGFPALAAGTRAVWNLGRAAGDAQAGLLESLTSLRGGHNAAWRAKAHPDLCECVDVTPQRAFNAACCEQSNGFSILGECPENDHTLGRGGHVPDKDGLLAGLLAAEAAAWAKARGMTLIEMLDRCVYADPAIGLFVGGYEPDPMDGEYPGLEGDTIKLGILARALEAARAPGFTLGGRKVTSAAVYRTGRYDEAYPPSGDFAFPDEGVRFYLDGSPLCHITVRPSGTGNSLRFYQQLHEPVLESALVSTKARLMRDNTAILKDLRSKLQAPAKR